MKTSLRFVSLLAILTLGGCLSGAGWPKDSLVMEGESSTTVNTPWGPQTHVLKAKEVRTGKAAIPAK